MELMTMNCPNCGGVISKADRRGNEIVCPYCDSLILIQNTENAVETIAEPQAAHEKMITPPHCVAETLTEHGTLRKMLSYISDILGDAAESGELLSGILKMLQGKKEAATAASMEKDYLKVKEKLQDILQPEEDLILYKTAAFLSVNKLKTGMFLTDRRVGYLDGKEIFSVEYRDLDTLMIEIGIMDAVWWYPNRNEKIFLTALGITEREFAEILAFVILKATEATGEEHRITLQMK